MGFTAMTMVRAERNLFADLYEEVALRGVGGSPPQVNIGVRSVAHVGRLLRRERLSRGLSQAQLADMAAVGRRLVSELERGKSGIHAAQIFAVLAALKMRVAITLPETAKNISGPKTGVFGSAGA